MYTYRHTCCNTSTSSSTVQCITVRYSTVQYSIVHYTCSTVLYRSMYIYCMVWGFFMVYYILYSVYVLVLLICYFIWYCWYIMYMFISVSFCLWKWDSLMVSESIHPGEREAELSLFSLDIKFVGFLYKIAK